MKTKRSYLAAAFSARPLGMPVPPNWFGLAAFALLGFFIHPGLWLIGAGLEGLYLYTLWRSSRFRAAVDANNGGGEEDRRYEVLSASLDADGRNRQRAVEQQAAEIVGLLTRVGAAESQIGDVHRMAWLHLKLQAAKTALVKVSAAGARENEELAAQRARIEQRLDGDLDPGLRRSLEQQREVIIARQNAHADAGRRGELLDAELDRLRQQVSLVREQALLATDEQSAAQSLDSVSASLNEANRWLRDQRELFGGLDDMTDEPPRQLLEAKTATRFGRKVAQ
jgi:hypothetical protein